MPFPFDHGVSPDRYASITRVADRGSPLSSLIFERRDRRSGRGGRFVEEQRLRYRGLDGRTLEGLGDEEGRLRPFARQQAFGERSEEHTSELQSLMRISYAVFCLKKKIRNN